MKVLGVALLLMLLLAVGVFVYVGHNTNSIVKNAIEVKDVEIALREGRSTLNELDIGNPPGYAGAHAMRFGTVSVEIDPAQSTAAKKGLGVDPNQFESEAARRMRDTLKRLGHPTN